VPPRPRQPVYSCQPTYWNAAFMSTPGVPNRSTINQRRFPTYSEANSPSSLVTSTDDNSETLLRYYELGGSLHSFVCCSCAGRCHFYLADNFGPTQLMSSLGPTQANLQTSRTTPPPVQCTPEDCKGENSADGTWRSDRVRATGPPFSGKWQVTASWRPTVLVALCYSIGILVVLYGPTFVSLFWSPATFKRP